MTSAVDPCVRCVICCQAGLSSSEVQTELRTELKGLCSEPQTPPDSSGGLQKHSLALNKDWRLATPFQQEETSSGTSLLLSLTFGCTRLEHYWFITHDSRTLIISTFPHTFPDESTPPPLPGWLRAQPAVHTRAHVHDVADVLLLKSEMSSSRTRNSSAASFLFLMVLHSGEMGKNASGVECFHPDLRLNVGPRDAGSG